MGFKIEDFDGVIDGITNPLVEKLSEYIFKNNIDFDAESIKTLQEYSDKNVVYASFHSSSLSLLVIYSLLKKHSFKVPIAALEQNPFILQSFDHIKRRLTKWLDIFFAQRDFKHVFETDALEEVIRNKNTLLISLLSKKYFLRRYLESKYDSLRYLLEVQKKTEEPIYLLPEMIFWNMSPERTQSILPTKPTGERGFIFGLLGVIKSANPAHVRILPPLNLKEELKNASSDNIEDQTSYLRAKLLELYDQEKHATLGPVIKTQEEMMEKVLNHKEVLDQIEKLAKREKKSVNKLKKQAFGFYKEIAADYSIFVIRNFARVLDYVFNKIYDGIHYDQEALSKIREAAKRGPLVLVPCHKSHMDYLIISYLFYKNKLACPHIAAGNNLSFFPIGPIFRKSGAFFIRRSFRGLKLYSVIFKQYTRTLVQEGYSIEFFMEGGRTRTGKLVLPKLGFLYYLIEAVQAGYNKDIVFVPIAISYDRIMEEKSYTKELKGNEKEAENVGALVKMTKIIKKRYGKVYVSFNDPVSLTDIAKDMSDIKKIPDMVSNSILNRINEVMVVTPYSLTTMAMMLYEKKGIPRDIIKQNFIKLFDFLLYSKAHLSHLLLQNIDIDSTIDSVFAAYVNDKVLHTIAIDSGKDNDMLKDFYVLHDENRSRIGFYKNSIIHYFVPVSFISSIILYLNKDIKADTVKSEYEFLKDLFKKEFIYSEDVSGAAVLSQQLAYNFLLDKKYIISDDQTVTINEKNTGDVKLYASILKDHLESYFVVFDTILAINGSKIEKMNLIKEIRKNGLRMFHINEVHMAESLAVPNYLNAISKLSEMGILRGGSRDVKDAEIEIVDLEKAKQYRDKLKKYLDAI